MHYGRRGWCVTAGKEENWKLLSMHGNHARIAFMIPLLAILLDFWQKTSCLDKGR